MKNYRDVSMKNKEVAINIGNIKTKSENIMEKELIFTSNKEVTIAIGNIKTTFLDEMMLRFPKIVQGVFQELDHKSLTNCRNVSRACCDFIDNEKFYWLRKIQNCVSTSEFEIYFERKWNKVLKYSPTKYMKEKWSRWTFYKLLIDKNYASKKRQQQYIYSDILLSMFNFFVFYAFIFLFFVVFIVPFCSYIPETYSLNFGEFLEVPAFTIDLSLIAISLVYLSGCTQKYTNNLCFALIAYLC